MKTRRPYWLGALVLLVFALVATASMWRKTTTADEPIYVAVRPANVRACFMFISS